MLEIDTLDAFRGWIAEGSTRPPAACQALDLTAQPELEAEPFPDSLFLGCDLTPTAAAQSAHPAEPPAPSPAATRIPRRMPRTRMRLVTVSRLSAAP